MIFLRKRISTFCDRALAAVLCVAVGLFYIVIQVRHLTPPITGTDAAYGVGMIAYAGIGLVIGLPLGLFVYFKVYDFLRGPSRQLGSAQLKTGR